MTVYLERGYNRKEYQWVYKQYQNIYSKEIFMIYVGIDVAKDKHDCLSPIQMVKHYSNLLPFLTIVKVLKPYFRKYSPYQMI